MRVVGEASKLSHLDKPVGKRKQAEKKLAKSEAQYRRLFEAAQDGILILDGFTGRIIDVNPFLINMLGYRRQDFLGKCLWEIGSFKDAEAAKATFQDLQEKGYIRYEDLPLESRDGRRVEVEFVSNSYFVGQRKVIQCNIRDITERKQMEILKESEEKFRSLVESTSDWIWEINLNGIYIYASPKVKELLGYEPEEVIGKTPFDFMPAEEANRIAIKFKDIIETGMPIERLENTSLYKNGHPVILETSGVPIFDNNGQLRGYRGVDRDITERKQAEKALRESEKKYRYLAENASDIIWIEDMNLRCTYMSPSVTKVRGYTAEEAMAQSLEEVFTPSSAETAVKAFTEELAIESLESKDLSRAQTLELEFTCKNGSTVWCEVKASFIRDAEGQPVGILGAARDITERRNAEESLRQSEERYRTILEEMAESYYETDLAGNFTAFNDALCRHLGYSREEMMGMNYLVFTPPEDVKRVSHTSNQVYRTGKPVELFPREMIRKDGSRTFTETSIFPLRNKGGEIIGWRGVGRDVTERRQAEEALRRSEERYRTILAEIADSYFEVDLAGNLTFVNDATCHNLGYSREELPGMNYRDFTAEEDIEHVYQAFNEVYRTGEPNKGFLWKVIKKNGSEGFADASVSALRDREGKIIGFRGIGRDMTERKKEEQQMLTSGKLASVGEITASIAHEINNPLTGVLGYAQLLTSRHDIPQDIKQDLDIIYQEGQRAVKIIQNLLRFARQYKAERSFTDINELIKKTLELQTYKLRTSNIKLTTKLADDLPWIMVDYNQIQQVILNIVVNAMQAMAEVKHKGKITVTTGMNKDYVRISIADNGPGIVKGNFKKVFDPFFTTKPAGSGSGLGLSVCQSIITEHGGNICVQNTNGKGATFTIDLPAATGDEAVIKEDALAEKKRPRRRRKVGESILIVEDEPAIRGILTEILSEEGYQVHTASNGKDALRKLEEDLHNIYILDLKMPDMSGEQLYKIMKNKYPNASEGVIFMTGDTVTPETQDLLASTGRPFLSKPFDYTELIKMVDDALRERRATVTRTKRKPQSVAAPL